MAIVSKRELLQLKHPHYIMELLLAFSYIILKSIPFTAVHVFGTSEYSSRETELLIFIAILVAFKTRRRGHVNFLPYLSSACTMAKFGNFLLFFFLKPIYGFTYTAVLLAHLLMLPKPKYKGPEKVSYFLGNDFEKELNRDKKVSWLTEFYVSWNPDCNEFAGVFSELSAKYATDTFKFGKIDVARCPKLADTYGIDIAVTTKTLPTLILFKDGREYTRRPLCDPRNRTVPFSFSYENIVNTFNFGAE